MVFVDREANASARNPVNNDAIVPGFDDESCQYLEINLNKVDGQPLDLGLKLTGSIDAYNADCFKRRVMLALTAGFVRLRFFMEDVEDLSSTGVAAFLFLQRAVVQRGGDVILFDVSSKVRNLFGILCLSSSFRCLDTDDLRR